jgi:hypothetical protein
MGEIIKTFEEFVNENYQIDEKSINDKDWKRMLDLAAANNDGESTAKKSRRKIKQLIDL